MPFFQEFKAFVNRGNAVDLAVGVIIGAAFGKVVSSLVSDIIMPPIGILIGGLNFSDLGITLKNAGDGKAAIMIKYGLFINSIIDFIIIVFAIFVVIKLYYKLREEPMVKAPNTKNCPECSMPIPLAAKRCGHCCVNLA